MQRLLTARVRFRKEGILHEGWHAVECSKDRTKYGIAVEVMVGHVIEALHKLDVPLDAVVSIEIMWAVENSFPWSMVSMLLPKVKESRHARRYYQLTEG
jgi:hypothetical protein